MLPRDFHGRRLGTCPPVPSSHVSGESAHPKSPSVVDQSGVPPPMSTSTKIGSWHWAQIDSAPSTVCRKASRNFSAPYPASQRSHACLFFLVGFMFFCTSCFILHRPLLSAC